MAENAKGLQLIYLLEAANEGFPGGWLAEYYKEDGTFNDGGSGDTLAKFIVLELIETFDSTASAEDQLLEAVRVMNRAVSNIESVIMQLENVPVP